MITEAANMGNFYAVAGHKQAGRRRDLDEAPPVEWLKCSFHHHPLV